MILAAGGTAAQVSREPGMGGFRIAAGELLLHIPVQDLEAGRATSVHGLDDEQLVQLPIARHADTVTA